MEGTLKSAISQGLLVFAGIEDADDVSDIEWLLNKIVNLRIFDDGQQVPNISMKDCGGDIPVGFQLPCMLLPKREPSGLYQASNKPDVAIPLYEALIRQLEKGLGKPIKTGEFGADMKVELLNDGPVTIWIDNKAREWWLINTNSWYKKIKMTIQQAQQEVQINGSKPSA